MPNKGARSSNLLSAKVTSGVALLAGAAIVAVAAAWLMFSQTSNPQSESPGHTAIESPQQPPSGANSMAVSPPTYVDRNTQNPIETLAAQIQSRAPHVEGGTVGILFDLLYTSGAFVQSVRPNGPAAVAGIRAGDVIAAINGTVVLNGLDAEKLIGAVAPGGMLSITIERGGTTIAFPVTVEAPNSEELKFRSSVTDARWGQPARDAIRKMNR